MRAAELPLLSTRAETGVPTPSPDKVSREKKRRREEASASARELTRGPGAPPRRRPPQIAGEGRRRRDGAPGRRDSLWGEERRKRRKRAQNFSGEGKHSEEVTTECRKVLPFSKNNLTVSREPNERYRLSETRVVFSLATLRARARTRGGATFCHDRALACSSAQPQGSKNPVV